MECTETASVPQPIRSCNHCRHRKIKCDRQHPCSNCSRNGRGNDCIYLAGPGRRPKCPRRVTDIRLLNRLERLENIIKQLATAPAELSNQSDDHSDENQRKTDDPSSTSVKQFRSHSNSSSVDQELGRLVINDTKSYYVGNIFWANLGKEVEELRNILAGSASNEEEASPESCGPFTPLNSDASILGLEPVVDSLFAYHPLLPDSMKLLQIFTENVASVVNIFHMPSIECMFWDIVASPDSLDKDKETLLFAIYYSAIISLSPSQCMATLGSSREDLLRTYRFAVKQALARANLLKTDSIVVLQAAVLFIDALRNEDDTRTVWSLTALVVHIAKAMGLHRDGTAFALKPFDTELRRRLWYHICLLDVRSSDHHGFEPIINGHQFDTKLPLHVNDNDLSPDMPTPPIERDGICEMTLCLVRSEYIRLCWKLKSTPSIDQNSNSPSNAVETLNHRQKLIDEYKTKIEEHYLRHCNANDPFQILIHTVARLMIARCRLNVFNSCSSTNTPDGSTYDTTIRDHIFQQSIGVLELSCLLLQKEELARWNWHTKTYMQWQSVAFTLSEICSRPPSPDCDRAWVYACALFRDWETKKPAERGLLWAPIKRLIAKTRYMRELRAVQGSEALEKNNIIAPPQEIKDTTFNNNSVNYTQLDLPQEIFQFSQPWPS